LGFLAAGAAAGFTSAGLATAAGTTVTVVFTSSAICIKFLSQDIVYLIRLWYYNIIKVYIIQGFILKHDKEIGKISDITKI
jgi:hypothetical protein